MFENNFPLSPKNILQNIFADICFGSKFVFTFAPAFRGYENEG
jgi:hypothetical protein